LDSFGQPESEDIDAPLEVGKLTDFTRPIKKSRVKTPRHLNEKDSKVKQERLTNWRSSQVVDIVIDKKEPAANKMYGYGTSN
jgi:hypothetical protein